MSFPSTITTIFCVRPNHNYLMPSIQTQLADYLSCSYYIETHCFIYFDELSRVILFLYNSKKYSISFLVTYY